MKFVQPPFKGENKGHYTPGIISKGMLYVSGQLSIDPDTREVCRGDIRAHARLALGNVDRVLKEAGVRRDQVVYCRVFTTKGEYWARSTRSTPNSSARTSPAASSPPCPSCTSAASSRSRPWPSSTRTDPHLFFWETAT